MLQPPRLNTAATYTQTAQRRDRGTKGSSRSRSRATSICCCTAIRSPTGGCRATPTRRCSTSTSAAIRTANFAIAGDTTQGVLWGLHNGEGQGFQPKADHADDRHQQHRQHRARRKSPKGSARSSSKCGKDFPNAKILLLAIFPRSVPGDPVRDKIADVNKIISKLDDQQHVFYMDIGAKFLDDEGRVPARRVPRRTTCTRRRRATTSGAKRFKPSWRNC